MNTKQVLDTQDIPTKNVTKIPNSVSSFLCYRKHINTIKNIIYRCYPRAVNIGHIPFRIILTSYNKCHLLNQFVSLKTIRLNTVEIVWDLFVSCSHIWMGVKLMSSVFVCFDFDVCLSSCRSNNKVSVK